MHILQPQDAYGWQLISERLCMHYREDYSLTLDCPVSQYIWALEPGIGREKAPAAMCRKTVRADGQFEIDGVMAK
jgi:hypothetical protein